MKHRPARRPAQPTILPERMRQTVETTYFRVEGKSPIACRRWLPSPIYIVLHFAAGFREWTASMGYVKGGPFPCHHIVFLYFIPFFLFIFFSYCFLLFACFFYSSFSFFFLSIYFIFFFFCWLLFWFLSSFLFFFYFILFFFFFIFVFLFAVVLLFSMDKRTRTGSADVVHHVTTRP